MPRPDPHMVGDQASLTPRPDPIQVGTDQDSAAHRRGMHRVVVAVQPDIVVPRQPQSVLPPSAGRHRRQRQHRRLISGNPVRRGTP
jgi:hypothetical protein